MARSLSALSLGLLLAAAEPARADVEAVPVLNPDGSTLFSHPDTWWWVSGQVNLITQAHPTFTSPYSGPNSLSAGAEARTSYVATLYLGARVTHHRVDRRRERRWAARHCRRAGHRRLQQPRRGAQPDARARAVHRARADPAADSALARRVESPPRPAPPRVQGAAQRLELRAGKFGDRRLLRRQPRRLRQPPAVHELGRRQQRRL